MVELSLMVRMRLVMVRLMIIRLETMRLWREKIIKKLEKYLSLKKW